MTLELVFHHLRTLKTDRDSEKTRAIVATTRAEMKYDCVNVTPLERKRGWVEERELDMRAVPGGAVHGPFEAISNLSSLSAWAGPVPFQKVFESMFPPP